MKSSRDAFAAKLLPEVKTNAAHHLFQPLVAILQQTRHPEMPWGSPLWILPSLLRFRLLRLPFRFASGASRAVSPLAPFLQASPTALLLLASPLAPSSSPLLAVLAAPRAGREPAAALGFRRGWPGPVSFRRQIQRNHRGAHLLQNCYRRSKQILRSICFDLR